MSRSRPIAPGLPTYWSWINGRVRSQVVIAEIQTGAVTRSATDETDDTTTLFCREVPLRHHPVRPMTLLMSFGISRKTCTIRSQGPYGPHSSGGNTRCKIAQNRFLIQQRITAKRPGLA